MADGNWQVFDLKEIQGKLKGNAVEYLEFLNVPALNCGIYSLAAGSKDMQAPHDEDEVYFIVAGKGRVRVDGREQDVSAGSVLFVSATAAHSFFGSDVQASQSA